MSKYQEVKDEMAMRVVNACGSTGILNAVDNDHLEGDVKERHKSAIDEVEKKFGKNAAPWIQAIYARIYGLI